MALHYVSDDDIEKIRAAFDAIQRLTPTLRAAPPPKDPFFTPETYVALTPPAGIPAASEGPTTGTADDRPGRAICFIYDLRDPVTGTGAPTYFPIPGLFKTVYNLSKGSIAGNSRILVTRNKTGRWFVLNVSPQQIAQCFSPYTEYYERVRCEKLSHSSAHTLVIYQYQRSFAIGPDGCWGLQPEVLVARIPTDWCCNPCAGVTGTGTGTGIFPHCVSLGLPIPYLCLTFIETITSQPNAGGPPIPCDGSQDGQVTLPFLVAFSANCAEWVGFTKHGCRVKVTACCNQATGMYNVTAAADGGFGSGGTLCCNWTASALVPGYPFPCTVYDDRTGVPLGLISVGRCGTPVTGTGSGGGGGGGTNWWCITASTCTGPNCTSCGAPNPPFCDNSSTWTQVGQIVCIGNVKFTVFGGPFATQSACQANCHF